MNSQAVTHRALTGPTAKPSFRQLLVRWLVDDFDYRYVIEHHSLRPLYHPMRVILAGNTALLAVCAMLLLSSREGPSTTAGVVWVWIVLAVQLVVITFILTIRKSFLTEHARGCLVGFGIFGDVGLTSVLFLYSPTVSAFACVFFVVNSALCTFLVSSRWLLVHTVFVTVVIVLTALRLQMAGMFDTQAVIAGTIVLVAAVDGIPAVAHFAWSTLSTDSRQAIRDPLTGLLNRRGADVSVEPLWSAAVEAGHAVAVVVVDVDDFKRINDNHGHDEGDRTLRRIADALDAAVGDGVLARTGGEEFTAYLAGTPDELRRRIAAVPTTIGNDGTIGCSISVGAAIITQPAVAGVGLGVVLPALRTADTLMYEAKQRGGGRALTTDVEG
ncbi:diguanylate cyclase [uncultured Williamsia sp.]|uniref:diguanylate cyclase domain-containing protein n=1 Tax=uncultured Williamsia sp. TaxID=259311 RepID=UPI0026327289|nr:diguanylate cyclase [uncultured Williamsia sp.]